MAAMLADIFEQDVNIPESFESSALGAVVIGMKSLELLTTSVPLNQWWGLHTNTILTKKLRGLPGTITNLDPVNGRISRRI